MISPMDGLAEARLEAQTEAALREAQIRSKIDAERRAAEEIRAKYRKFGPDVEKLVLNKGSTCDEGCTLSHWEAAKVVRNVTSSSLDLSAVALSEPTRHTAGPLGTIYDWQTRILELQPGSFGETLKASLCAADFVHGSGIVLHTQQSRIEYDALSYCWGQRQLTHYIECDGVLLPTTANLHAALQHLRWPDKVRYIWIDQLCIDQSDLAERAMQVSNMLLIYQKATKVIIWLGDQTESSSLVFECFALGSPKLCNKHSRILSAALHHVLRLPWFRRVWIKQELWAADDADVMCGSCTLGWDLFEMRAKDMIEDNALREIGSANPLDDLRRASRGQRALVSIAGQERAEITTSLSKPTRHRISVRDENELLNILLRTSRAECSDLRDHVYGILGMAGINPLSMARDSQIAGSHFVVDYKRSIAEVYQDVVRYYLWRDQKLWVFNAFLDYDLIRGGLKIGGDLPNGDVLPTWCPDWNAPLEMLNQTQQIRREEFTSNDALHACELRTWYDPSLLDGPSHILRLSGIPLAQVEWLGNQRSFYAGLAIDFHEIEPAEAFAKTDMLCSIGQIKRYSQAFGASWRKREHNAKQALLKAPLKELDKCKAKYWYSKGRLATRNDIIVAVEGSIEPFVLRPKQSESRFEFVGVATKERHFDSTDKRTWDAIQDLLVLAKMENLLEIFEIV